MRLRVSGSDNSTSNYHNHISATASSAATYLGVANASSAQFRIGGSNGVNSVKSTSMDLFNPFASERTQFLGLHLYSSANGANGYDGGQVHGSFNDTTSFTGFSIIPGSGTITGSVRVYGYNQ